MHALTQIMEAVGERMAQTPRFKIGTTFTPQSRKGAGVHTVTDVLTTRNSKGEVVKIRYEATHEFMGQTLTDNDVLETTIARGLISQPSPILLEVQVAWPDGAEVHELDPQLIERLS